MTTLPPKTPQSRFENINTRIYQDASFASKAVAQEISNLIKQKASEGKECVLGLATGSTPTAVYAELVRMHKEDGLSFKNVVTFNLDEYYPVQPDALQSYVRFMKEYLFDHIDIEKENINIPDGTLPKDKIQEYCEQYEAKIKK